MRGPTAISTFVLGLCVVAMLSGGCVRIDRVGIGGFGGSGSELLEKTVIPADVPRKADKVLMLDIEGTIGLGGQSSFLGGQRPGLIEQLRSALDKARKDDAIKAVVLRINSPGGELTATDIIYQELEAYKEDTDVKVVAALVQVAASGGYYVACAADRIVAHPTTITGSISVIANMINIEGLMDKVGVEHEVVKSGELKDMGSLFRPMTPEERALFQELIDGSLTRFVEVVEQGRPNLTHEEVVSLANGRVFSATQAKEVGLVDEIGYLEDAFDAAKTLAGIDDAALVVYSYRTTEAFNIYTPTATSASSALPALNARTAEYLLRSFAGPGYSSGPSLMCLWDSAFLGQGVLE